VHRKIRRNLTIGVLVLAAVAFAGGAYAATQSGTDGRQAFLNDVAKRLNVTPAQLQSALRGATLDQLQAAVKAGKLTQAQANQIAQALAQGRGPGFPFFGFRGEFHRFGGPGFKGGLDAVASYLGLTQQQLFQQLSSGKSLAQIAKDRGKSVTGLEQALTAAAKSKLDRAVKDGRITAAEEKQLLAQISARIADEVSGTRFEFPRFHGWHDGPPRGGAPGGLLVPPAALPGAPD
jgi:hypothetical protein